MKATKNTIVKYSSPISSVLLSLLSLATPLATAGTVESKLYSTSAHHQYLGKIIFTDSNDGLLIEPNLNHVPFDHTVCTSMKKPCALIMAKQPVDTLTLTTLASIWAPTNQGTLVTCLSCGQMQKAMPTKLPLLLA